METHQHGPHLPIGSVTPITRASSPLLGRETLLGREHLAYRFLESTWFANDGLFPCWTSTSASFETRTAVPPEVFTSMIILEALKDSRLSHTVKDDIVELLAVTRSRAAVHHFFLEKEKLPADADCTGIAHSLLWEAGLLDEAAAQATAQAICKNTDAHGVLAVYFTDAPDRQGVVDPVVCANALHFLNRVGAAGRAVATERFLFETLEKKSYLAGTRYYPSPETFLFFVSRLATDFPVRYQGLLSMLRSHVGSRLGKAASPLELAFRIASATRLGLPTESEKARLRALQQANGAWPADVFFRYGRSGQVFGSEAVTTALALHALADRTERTFSFATSAPRRAS